MSPQYSYRRRLLNQSRYAAVSASTCAAFRHGRRGLISSVLNNPLIDSANELSCASPTVPIEASMPSSISRCVNLTDVYWLPASLLNRIRFKPGSLDPSCGICCGATSFLL